MNAMNTIQNIAPTTQGENAMKLNKQQANHLQRLFVACGNAKNFSESNARQERLDSYMERLMEQGIDIKEINDLLY